MYVIKIKKIYCDLFQKAKEIVFQLIIIILNNKILKH